MWRILVRFLMLFGLVLSACDMLPGAGDSTAEQPAMANPASKYCIEQDGRLEIRDEEEGQIGYCLFANDSECEEWAFLRGECVPGEDYQVWEVELPCENTTGFNPTEIGDKPTACWWNLNAGWSYQPWNHNLKSADEIIAAYQAARERNAVFFLNVGPRPFGDINPAEQHVLREIGTRLRSYTHVASNP